MDCLLRRVGAKPILRQYCQDLIEKVIETIESDLLTQQLEIIFHLFSLFASVHKSAKRAAKLERIGHVNDKYQVEFGGLIIILIIFYY